MGGVRYGCRGWVGRPTDLGEPGCCNKHGGGAVKVDRVGLGLPDCVGRGVVWGTWVVEGDVVIEGGWVIDG